MIDVIRLGVWVFVFRVRRGLNSYDIVFVVIWSLNDFFIESDYFRTERRVLFGFEFLLIVFFMRGVLGFEGRGRRDVS